MGLPRAIEEKNKYFFLKKKNLKVSSLGRTRKKEIISAIPNINSIALRLKETYQVAK